MLYALLIVSGLHILIKTNPLCFCCDKLGTNFVSREKGRDLTQSYDKTPTPTEK